MSAAAQIALQALLALAVAASWLAALAFLRLRTPLERMHVVTFVNVACGAAVVAAAYLTDGITSRSLKSTLLWLALLLGGALLSHVSGRALLLRDAEHR